jgi:hypothetical protein
MENEGPLALMALQAPRVNLELSAPLDHLEKLDPPENQVFHFNIFAYLNLLQLKLFIFDFETFNSII